jgi:DNA-binding transcriptional ArsR family regulator
MSRLLPFRPSINIGDDRAPRLVDVDDEVADEVFMALSSGTARKILATLYDEPHTTSELADAVDTSVQNASYHLDKLSDAGLVEVVDTWYSERGTEMKVYAPRDESLVVFAGSNKKRTFRKLLARLVGAIGLLGGLWFIADRVTRLFSGAPGGGRHDSPRGGGEATTVPPNGTTNATTTVPANTTSTPAANTTHTTTSSSLTTGSVHPPDLMTASFPPELTVILVSVLLVSTVFWWYHTRG